MFEGNNRYPGISEYPLGPTAMIKASKWFGTTGIRLGICHSGAEFLQSTAGVGFMTQYNAFPNAHFILCPPSLYLSRVSKVSDQVLRP